MYTKYPGPKDEGAEATDELEQASAGAEEDSDKSEASDEKTSDDSE